MPRVRTLTLLFSVGALAGACFEDSGGGAPQSSTTLIGVTPSDFLGKVPCIDAEGAMRVYVATAYDISEGVLEGSTEPFVLPSSGPTQCHQTVAFGFVAPLHDYVVRVEGYDTADVRPLDRGSPVMLDSQGRFVPPRWTSFCTGSRARPTIGADAALDADADDVTLDAAAPDPDADPGDVAPEASLDPDADPGDAAAEATTDDAGVNLPDAAPSGTGAACEVDPLSARGRGVRAIRYIGAPGITRHASVCTPICDRGQPTPTGMVVRVSDALGGLECGDAPGQVSTFNVLPENASLSAQDNVACSGEARYEGVEPNASYGFIVTAFEAGNSAPRWGTHCDGVAAAGAAARATCKPLSSTGTLQIDVAELLSQAGLSCDDVGRISAALSGAPAPRVETSGPPACLPMRFSDLASGLQAADVSIEPAGAGTPRTARCEGVVLPGNSTTASCLVSAGSP